MSSTSSVTYCAYCGECLGSQTIHLNGKIYHPVCVHIVADTILPRTAVTRTDAYSGQEGEK